jgi:7-cyano-7-deazaguanine synthase
MPQKRPSAYITFREGNTMAGDLAIVLASGGMDSTVTIGLAREAGMVLALMHVNYLHLTETRELLAFNEVARYYGVPEERRLVTNIAHLAQIGGSALTDPAVAVPENRPLEQGGIPVSYVPQRNGNLLFIAAAWAEKLGAASIWAGMVEEDSSGYPDCRRSFCDAVEKAIAEGNHDEHIDPRVITPLIHMSKADIVRTGLRLAVPFGITWSCYQREDVACGVCDSCRLRLRGFADAGVVDPLPYAE